MKSSLGGYPFPLAQAIRILENAHHFRQNVSHLLGCRFSAIILVIMAQANSDPNR